MLPKSSVDDAFRTSCSIPYDRNPAQNVLPVYYRISAGQGLSGVKGKYLLFASISTFLELKS